MPDITMCEGEGCPEKLRDNCYRYTAEPSPYRQSYFSKSPFHHTAGRCSYYTPNDEQKEVDSNEE